MAGAGKYGSLALVGLALLAIKGGSGNRGGNSGDSGDVLPGAAIDQVTVSQPGSLSWFARRGATMGTHQVPKASGELVQVHINFANTSPSPWLFGYRVSLYREGQELVTGVSHSQTPLAPGASRTYTSGFTLAGGGALGGLPVGTVLDVTARITAYIEGSGWVVVASMDHPQAVRRVNG